MFAFRSIPAALTPALVLSALLFTGPGCSREEIQSYRIPKETRTAASGHDHEHHPGDGHDHGTAPAPAIPKLMAKTPAGWTEGTPGGMRVARFTVPGQEGGPDGDVSVIPLPSFRGSEFEVVNLWRESIKLPRAGEAELKPMASQVAIGSGDGSFYDMTSTEAMLDGKKGRIAAAILERGGITWFFKMMGTESMVRAQKDAFLAYLKSVEFEDPPADAAAAAGSPPASAPAAPRAGGGETSAGRPEWTVPASWQQDAAPAMALAGFRVTGDAGASASVSVTRLAGDGGGLLPNINRWRNQLGLSALSEADLKREGVILSLTSGQATVVDMAGRDARSGKDARMLGGVILRGSESWFFKMTGDPALVARERPAFEGFVKSIRF